MTCAYLWVRTLVLGRGSDLAEELDVVGQVIAQELGLENEVLAGVVGGEVGSEELRFADDAERRATVGSLECN